MMISQAQQQRASAFAQMHREGPMLVLPNAWSVGSACVFERQGFAALATSSAGMAYDWGLPDGQCLPFDDLVWVVERMTARIETPLSVDFERGYGETGEAVAQQARRLLEAGAVGLNLEDGQADGQLSPLALQLEKIAALAQLKQELVLDFVINARTCAYWLDVAGEEEKLAIALERGNAFLKAGADCVFVPGAVDEATARRLVDGIEGPVNLILNGRFGDFKQLDALGVRRLSLGSGPARYSYGKVIELANQLRRGDATALLTTAFSYDKANCYFARSGGAIG